MIGNIPNGFYPAPATPVGELVNLPPITIWNKQLIKFGAAVQNQVVRLALDAVPDAGSLAILKDGDAFVTLAFDDDASELQTKIQAVMGYETATVVDDSGDYLITLPDDSVLSAGANTLVIGVTPVVPTFTIEAEFLPAATTGIIPTEGQFSMLVDAGAFIDILYTDTAALIEAKARLVEGFEYVSVSGSFAAGFAFTFTGIAADPVITFAGNTMKDVAERAIILAKETLASYDAP